jgi:hypothetical protein
MTVVFLRCLRNEPMATLALGAFNSNSAGLGVGDVIVYSIGGFASYVVTDYAFPNAGDVETSITSFLSGIPIVGTFWSGAEDLDSIAKGLTSLSPLVGLLAGIGGQMATKDGSVGLLTAMAACSLQALWLNGTIATLMP